MRRLSDLGFATGCSEAARSPSPPAATCPLTAGVRGFCSSDSLWHLLPWIYLGHDEARRGPAVVADALGGVSGEPGRGSCRRGRVLRARLPCKLLRPPHRRSQRGRTCRTAAPAAPAKPEGPVPPAGSTVRRDAPSPLRLGKPPRHRCARSRRDRSCDGCEDLRGGPQPGTVNELRCQQRSLRWRSRSWPRSPPSSAVLFDRVPRLAGDVACYTDAGQLG